MSKAAAEEVAPPISRDPRATLRDLPAQKSGAQAARSATARRREDEISIPPTTGEPATDLDDHFFAEGEASAHHDAVGAKLLAAQAHLDDVELRHAHAEASVPPERRQRMANYVKGAVGVCAVLCLVAVARVGFGHAAKGAYVAHVASPSAAAAQVAAISPPADPVPTPAAAIPPPPAEEPVAAPADPAPPTKTAKEEKEDARVALEHGKRDVSVEAATRSVALDPTDAEAWLILGSAQQDSGHWKEGRESYAQCTKQATVGPVAECKMMLR